jgi:TrmH family RNA methyltransferase
LGRRREPGAVFLEGPRLVHEALASGIGLELLALREGVDFEAPARRTVVLSERAFDAARQTVSSQGVIALARFEEAPITAARAAAAAAGWPLPVLDGVQDPGNVGTILRTAAACGAPAVAVLDGSADPLGAKAVRAAAGTVFRLRVARGTWDELGDLPGYGAVARGGVPPEGIDLDRCAVIGLGNEAAGLRRADLLPVTIPMAEGVESMNVAAAAAILLSHIGGRVRRRGPGNLSPFGQSQPPDARR